MKTVTGTRLPKPILLATCGDDMKLYKTVEPDRDGTVTVMERGKHAVTYPGPIGYIERDGKVYPEQPVFTCIKMMPYWDFLADPDQALK